MGERLEILMRIIVAIVTGFIIGIWKILVYVTWIVQLINILLTGKRHKGMAEFANLWLSTVYRFARYMLFISNIRPFPFNELGKELEKADVKVKK